MYTNGLIGESLGTHPTLLLSLDTQWSLPPPEQLPYFDSYPWWFCIQLSNTQLLAMSIAQLNMILKNHVLENWNPGYTKFLEPTLLAVHPFRIKQHTANHVDKVACYVCELLFAS